MFKKIKKKVLTKRRYEREMKVFWDQKKAKDTIFIRIF